MTIKLQSNLYVKPVNIFPNFGHCDILSSQPGPTETIYCEYSGKTVIMALYTLDHRYRQLIDQFHKSQNAPVPYPTMLHSEQKCTHFCSEWSIVGYGTGAFWDLWIKSIWRLYCIATAEIWGLLRQMVSHDKEKHYYCYSYRYMSYDIFLSATPNIFSKVIIWTLKGQISYASESLDIFLVYI